MGKPIRVYFSSEIILDEGKLPSGVDIDDLCQAIDRQIWGVMVPNLEVEATRERGRETQGHVHDSTQQDACQYCVNTATDGQNRDNVREL